MSRHPPGVFGCTEMALTLSHRSRVASRTAPSRQRDAEPTGRPHTAFRHRVAVPTAAPTIAPIAAPAVAPTATPTAAPTIGPTHRPNCRLNRHPNRRPSHHPIVPLASLRDMSPIPMTNRAIRAERNCTPHFVTKVHHLWRRGWRHRAGTNLGSDGLYDDAMPFTLEVVTSRPDGGAMGSPGPMHSA